MRRLAESLLPIGRGTQQKNSWRPFSELAWKKEKEDGQEKDRTM